MQYFDQVPLSVIQVPLSQIFEVDDAFFLLYEGAIFRSMATDHYTRAAPSRFFEVNDVFFAQTKVPYFGKFP